MFQSLVPSEEDTQLFQEEESCFPLSISICSISQKSYNMDQISCQVSVCSRVVSMEYMVGARNLRFNSFNCLWVPFPYSFDFLNSIYDGLVVRHWLTMQCECWLMVCLAMNFKMLEISGGSLGFSINLKQGFWLKSGFGGKFYATNMATTTLLEFYTCLSMRETFFLVYLADLMIWMQDKEGKTRKIYVQFFITSAFSIVSSIQVIRPPRSLDIVCRNSIFCILQITLMKNKNY